MTPRNDPVWLGAAVAAYRVVLAFYPRGFRRAAEREMVAAFRRRVREAVGRPGGRIGAALREGLDLLLGLPATWLERPGGTAPGSEGMEEGWTHGLSRTGWTMNGWTTGGWVRDVGRALRGIRRRPGFAAVVILTLAVAIGANATVFGIVRGVLLEPLPYPEPAELTYILETDPSGATTSVSWLNYRDWRERSRAFESMGARTGWSFTMTSEGPAEVLSARLITPSLLDLLGVEPIQGRSFTRDELRRGERLVLLSGDFWRRRFGSNPSLVGSTLQLDGEPFVVAGVLPERLEFPMDGADVFAPMSVLSENDRTNRASHPGISVVGRLADGTDLEEARREMEGIAAELAREHPDTNAEDGVSVRTLRERVVGDAGGVLFLLQGAVALVLLIACANVANLLLARSAERGREVAVRTSLGAGRASLVRHMLGEVLVLAGIGAALGGLLAVWAIGLFRTLQPGDLPRIAHVEVDGHVLLFTAVLTVITALLAGVVPAIQASRVEPAAILGREGSRGSSGAGGALRRGLVVSEVALSVVLLMGAGLMVRTMDNLLGEDTGLDTQGVLSVHVPSAGGDYSEPEARAGLFAELLRRVEVLPAVTHVAGVDPLPLSGFNRQWTISGEGLESVDDAGIRTEVGTVTPNYFSTLGIRVLRGTTFTGDETGDGVLPIMVDETFAERLWPGGDPLGRTVRFTAEGSPPMQVVGVVEHVRHYGVTGESGIQLYRPYTAGVWSLTLVVRADGDPMALVPRIREILSEVAPSVAATRIRMMEEYERESMAAERLTAGMLQLFGGVALLLAVVGLYGVISYSVAQRTREFGIRLAIGARSGRVVAGVTGEGLGLAVAGVGLGVLAAFFASRLLETFLFGVEPLDPATFLAVGAGMILVSGLAAFVPAVRTTRIDPAEALRME